MMAEILAVLNLIGTSVVIGALIKIGKLIQKLESHDKVIDDVKDFRLYVQKEISEAMKPRDEKIQNLALDIAKVNRG